MVYIICGGIDKGKTQKMISFYRRMKQGDGFVCRKIFDDQSDFIGYEILRLGTGEKMTLAYRSRHVPPAWDESCRCGPYHFSGNAFAFAESIVDDIVARKIEPVFIDEIGPLELSGKGFNHLLERVLETGKDVYITVRDRFVQGVIEKFKIQDFRMIWVEKDR